MTLIDPRTIDLLRYLLVLRIQHPLVIMPNYPALELAHATSAMIAERLPTTRIKPWRKLLAAWEEANPPDRGAKRGRWILNPPDADWPVELVWLPYQVKQTYGQGETLLCELKLLGRDVSHELFLEMILPVLEEAGIRKDGRWNRPNALWGRYHLSEVYVARGPRWEPVVEDGRIDFAMRPGTRQWAEGLDMGESRARRFSRLKWTTPYVPDQTDTLKQVRGNPNLLARENAPELTDLLTALGRRLDTVAPGWNTASEQEALIQSLLDAAKETTSKTDKINAPPKYYPGMIWGEQSYTPIPPLLIPELELASILHLGHHTHVGCGTFRLY